MNESDLQLAVREVLERALDGHKGMNFDTKTVCDEICRFIFRRNVGSTWCNRYEWLYELQSKAMMLVQGWLLNYAPHIKHYRETLDSVAAYIENTYGVRRANYAA